MITMHVVETHGIETAHVEKMRGAGTPCVGTSGRVDALQRVDSPGRVLTPQRMDAPGRVLTPQRVETPKLGVSTTTTSSSPLTGIESRKCASIGVVVNQYKRICTIETRKINSSFAWQSRFYDRIIRDDNEFKNVQEYINNNPAKWSDDDYYGGGL